MRIVRCLAILLFPIFFSRPACCDREQLPNIVVILADDLGYGDVQTLNDQSRIPTPNFDRLASEGMTFTDSHSPSAVCTPTRYGLLTGRYCWRTRLKRGVLGGYSPPLLNEDRITLPEMLRTQGYLTGAIGKWHLGMTMPLVSRNVVAEAEQAAGDETVVDLEKWAGDPGIDFRGTITNGPTDHGFDYYFGHTASLDMAPYVFICNDRFTKTPSLQQERQAGTAFIREGPRADDFIIDEVLNRLTTEAVQFVHRSAHESQPFFLYFPLTAPHKPVAPHSRFHDKTPVGRYGDFIHQVDWTVGQVMQAIDQAGVRDNTLLIVTSDNGSFMFTTDEQISASHLSNAELGQFRTSEHSPNGPFRGTKADIYEAGHHVPFFARWPARIAAASKCDQTVCHVDLFATCAELTGYQVPEQTAEDSCSLLTMLYGNVAPRTRPVIHHSSRGMFAIRQGKWKLIAGNGSGGRAQPRGEPFAKPYQLFDMASDIAETNNLAEQHPEVVAALTAALDQICN